MSERRSRAENRRRMETEILRLARQQLEEKGPADLSLREIARDMSVASSALYRYVRDRDELLTLLVIDAYTDLADAVDDALGLDPEERGGAESPEGLGKFARAMRSWALANTARWGLVYGTPVPGYAAPADQTVAPGTRLLARLAHIVAAGNLIGADPSGPYAAFLEGGLEDVFGTSDRSDLDNVGAEAGEACAINRGEATRRAATTIDLWCALLGTISAEVFDQLGPGLDKVGGEVLERLVESWTATLFPETVTGGR